MVELIKLEMEGFGKFAKNEIINFKKGINFITGLNETGKSTILEAVLASLFKYSGAKIQPFFCWKNPDVCKLILTYKTDKGETFRVISDYKNNKKKLEKITKGGTSEISTTISTIHQYIKEHFGFDEQKVFENTTFIRQSQMAILEDSTTKNKIKDMIEEVFAGTAEASATKALKKIKKVSKDNGKEAEALKGELFELNEDLKNAEETKEGVTEDTKKHEDVSKKLTDKSAKLENLKQNKKLFDEKEDLLEEEKNINEKIENVDELIDTIKEQEEKPSSVQQNKILPIILIVAGIALCFTRIGALIGVPLIIYGIYVLVKKQEPKQKPESSASEKILKYKKQKKDLINKKATVETKLEKYKLVKFTIDDFRDLDKLGEEVDKLKTKDVQLKTSISKTKELVKSPEEIQEEVDNTSQKINELKEKSEEYDIAYKFLEKAETGVQHKFTPSIEKDSKPFLKEVTDDKYTDLKIDEESLDISVKAPEIKDYVDVDILSQGAKDQIYFTVRTTMSDLLSGNINLPLIFDDPFHNFDDPRLKKTINAIKKISQKKQIILISHRPYQKDFKNFAENVIEV